MPAGMVRPRASQVPKLARAVILEWVDAGWHLTELGHLDHGQWTGPCATCQTPCCRYGPTGAPLCPACR